MVLELLEERVVDLLHKAEAFLFFYFYFESVVVLLFSESGSGRPRGDRGAKRFTFFP